MLPPAPPAGHRRYDIDALRVIAFALLILYHAAMFYVADWHWHVKSPYQVEWLQYPMMAVNRWRMPLLFMISGLAVNFMLRGDATGRFEERRTTGQFAGRRTVRLLVPLLFGMAVVVPPQAYVQALANGAFDGGYADFLAAYLAFRPWPPGAFDGWQYGITWNHLWYLPYLLAYSLVLAGLRPLLESAAGLRLRDRLRALRGVGLAVLPALPLVFATWMLSARFPDTHDLINDWHNHAVYFIVFLYGYWIGTDDELWAELERLRWPMLGGALAALGAFLFLDETLLLSSPPWQRAGYDFFEYLYQWTALLAILGWGRRLLNRPFRWLPYATEAVFSWYVLHQTLIVVAGYELAKLSLGPVIEPAVVLLITLLGCLVLHELVIRRSALFRPLFGLKAQKSH